MSGHPTPDREQHTLDESGLVCSCHARFSTRWEAAEHAGLLHGGPLAFADTPRPTREGVGSALGYQRMGSGGRCNFDQLREAVSEACTGTRDCSPFDPTYFPGHQMVAGINFNSLDRIVTAFVDAALLAQREQEGWREAVLAEREACAAIAADEVAASRGAHRSSTATSEMAYRNGRIASGTAIETLIRNRPLPTPPGEEGDRGAPQAIEESK